MHQSIRTFFVRMFKPSVVVLIALFVFPITSTFAAVLTTVDSTGNVGQFNAVAIGSDGFARISYLDTTNNDLKFVQCTNADCSTKNITTVDSTGSVGRNTSIAIGSDGFARISYFDQTNADLKFAQCTNADCSTHNITTIDGAGNIGQTDSISIGSDGFARISYFDQTNNDLKFVQCTNAACTTNNITAVDTTGSVGQYNSQALGSDGFARISYFDITNGDLKFAQCTNADCSTHNITTIDSTGVVGRYTSLSIASDGFARVSYYDVDNLDLKFVQCTNADCSTKNITTVDSTGDVGISSSLSLGSDGFGRIGYYDLTNGDLKFAQCTNAVCSTHTITTVESTGNVGLYTSVALGASDFARIAYVDSTNLDLKFAQCIDSDCSGTSPVASLSLTGKSDTMSRLKVSTLSNHEVKFATTTGVTSGQSISITFPADFSIAASFDFNDADLAEGDSSDCSTANFTEKTLAATPSGATWGAARTSSTVFTLTSGTGTITATHCVRIRLGTNAVTGSTGTHQITNATTVGTKIITFGGTMADTGTVAVSIVDDDQVSLTGSVDPSITFDLDAANSDTESASPYTVALGSLTTGAVSTSSTSGSGVNSVWVDLSTNASHGAIIVVKSLNGTNGLVSVSTPADKIASATATLVAGTTGYGVCVTSSGTGAPTQASGATLTAASPFNGTCDASNHAVGGLTTSTQNILTASAPISAGRAAIRVKAAIGTAVPSHPDYTDTLTLIATGTF